MSNFIYPPTDLSPYPAKTEVSGAITGALQPYAKSEDVSSSFGLKSHLTASYARLSAANTFTATDNIFSNNITVNGTASIAMLNTVNQQSLIVGDKYITIMSGSNTHVQLDGAGILFGSGSADVTTGDQNSVAHIVYRKGNAPSDYTSDYIEVFPGLRVTGSLTASGNVNVPSITASVGFSGNGSKLTNIPASAVDLSLYATSAGVSASFTTPAQVTNTVNSSLTPYARSEDVSSSFGLKTHLTASYARLSAVNDFKASQLITGSVSITSFITASSVTSSFTGSGAGLYNIPASAVNLINYPTKTETSGAITGALTPYAKLNGENIFTGGNQIVTGSLLVTTSVSASSFTGSMSGTLVGPAGGILSGTYPNPSALIGAYTSSLYSIIPLSSSNSTRTAALMTGDSSTSANSLVIKTGDSSSPSNKAGSISILAGSSSYVGVASPYNGDISIVSEGDELIRAANTIRLIAGNYTPTLSSYGIYIEANPPVGMTDYISIGSNKPAGGGTLRAVDVGKSANAVTLGTSSIPIYTMGQDMRVPQYRTITNVNSTMAINAGTICLSATSNITMSGKPVMDVYTPDTPGQTPDGCRVTLINISDFDIAFPNDTSTTPVSPYSTGTYLSSSLKLGDQQRVLKKWGTLELQFQKSGSSSTSGGYWVETNFSNNLTGSYDLSPYATLTGVSASFTTPIQVSNAVTSALTPYAKLSGGNTFIAGNQIISGSVFVSSSLSASAITGSFTGSGAGLYNIPTSAVNLVNYPTKTEVSGAITGALIPYAKLNGGNIFTGNQEITGSINILGQSVLNGGQKVKISSKTSNYALTASSDYIVAFNGTSLTGTLPSASLTEGATFIIKNKNTSPLFITSSGGLIDGASNATISTRYYSYTLVSDGTDWNVI